MAVRAVSRDQWFWFWVSALLFLLSQSVALAQPSCCGGSGCCGGPHGEACTLTYGAKGVVRDSVTGDPIAGAFIGLLNVGGESGADGRFEVSGSRPDTCNLDYYYSLIVEAAGYEEFAVSFYRSAMFQTFDIELNPAGSSDRFTVSGTVAEFPPCGGRMRGVGVLLEPGGRATQTSFDASDGGRFAFYGVLPGAYVVHVVPGCNPYGCWSSEELKVEGSDVDVSLCMSPIDPNATPTPTRTVYPGPSITSTVCPLKTPCMLGEQPLRCGERCGLGCGCEPCPQRPDGKVSAPRFNFCECIPDPNVTPPPTSTPGNCVYPTPPLCSLGQTALCVTEDGCDSACSCIACDPCQPGQVYSGEPNGCLCVDPAQFTLTPTPTPTPTGPTPTVCPQRTACPDGLYPAPCFEPCGLSCGCEATRPPTSTPTPVKVSTPTSCPAKTSPLCSRDETLDCDFRIDQCGGCQCAPCSPCPQGFERGNGACECVVTAQPPDTRDDEAGMASGGCGIVAPRESDAAVWTLLLGALVLWRGQRRK